jgi:D-3-phosphoglycerate dehydrogenase
VCDKLIKFINVGSTRGAVNVPEVDLPEQASATEKAKRPHRILHFHKNVPGVLSKMHSLIAGMNANISAEYLRTNEEIGYVVLDVDPTDGVAIQKKLGEIPETIRVRLLW